MALEEGLPSVGDGQTSSLGSVRQQREVFETEFVRQTEDHLKEMTSFHFQEGFGFGNFNVFGHLTREWETESYDKLFCMYI